MVAAHGFAISLATLADGGLAGGTFTGLRAAVAKRMGGNMAEKAPGVGRKTVAAGILAAALAASAGAATVQGTISYAGLPVHTNFPSFTYGGAGAYSASAGTWTWGNVVIANDTYSITGLAPGDYTIYVRVSTSAVGHDVLPTPGSLAGTAQVTVAGEGTVTQAVNLLYGVHVTQPLDSATVWPGSCTVCPKGVEMPGVFTLAWDAVPQATSYTVTVRRWSCTQQVGSETYTTSSRSLQISQRTVSGEEFVLVEIAGFAGATQLTVTPYVEYTDCGWQTHAFHAPVASGGRPLHPSNSRFIPQIAHLAGNPPSFWKSDLFLTNPTSSAVTATLRYTPRGADGLATYQEVDVDVPARASRTVKDVLDALFHASGAGSLEISPATLEAACRVYTPGAGPGLYGQGFLPIGAENTAWLGGPATKLGTGGVAKGAYRSNLALVEVWGEGVTLRVVLLDRDGAKLGEKAVSLPPFGNTQINDVVGSLGGPSTIEEAQVVVEVVSGSGRVGAVLSVVDNGSQDPSTFPLVRR